ncbi:MAG: hypothetical protein AAB492_01110 [Patescibacteria group bacterium]
MKQTITYQLVDTAGEISAIVQSPISQYSMPKVATIIMRKNRQVEQVGFLNPVNKSFQMMGGELSVNGLLAAEFLKTGLSSIRIPLSMVRSVINNKITFKGMTYLLLPNPPSTTTLSTEQKNMLKNLASNNPASGIIYYQKSSIKPIIYVRATNSFVWEQSCGSGSIAYALYSGRRRIVQSSGKIVSIKITDTSIFYQAQTYACPKKIVLIPSKEVL